MRMEYETLFDGEKIPRLGLGTWRMGGSMSPDRSNDEELVRTIRHAIEIGYTHIDTAEMYGGGHTEELVGRAIRGIERERLFIVTKIWQSNLRYANISKALDGSLKRMGIDYVDLYLIHWPSYNVPLEETFRGLNELVADGRARRLGVSNFGLEEMKRAQSLSDTPIATNQVPYSLLQREYAQNGVLAYCQANNIILTAYSPIDKGAVIRNTMVREIANKYGASPAQVALSWLIRQPKVIAIPKAARREHVEDNLGALDIDLSSEDVQRLDRLG